MLEEVIEDIESAVRIASKKFSSQFPDKDQDEVAKCLARQ